MNNVVFCISGNGNHILFIKLTIKSIKELNNLYNICIGSYFLDDKMSQFANLNNYKIFFSEQNTDVYTNPALKFYHHKNVNFPELILEMSLCYNVYMNTDYEHVIFIHPDMYIGYDFLPEILLLNTKDDVFNTRLLTTYPYNRYNLINDTTPLKLLFITSDTALISGYRLNHPISLWKREFLISILKLYGTWEEIYKSLLYNESLCNDVSMFNFNRYINKKYNLKCNFLDVNKIVLNTILKDKICHLTFLKTRVNY